MSNRKKETETNKKFIKRIIKRGKIVCCLQIKNKETTIKKGEKGFNIRIKKELTIHKINKKIYRVGEKETGGNLVSISS